MQKELEALEREYSVDWREFNLEELFGKSTRGRRLKSQDRIEGNLPFVTAGEADTGISAYIGNDVQIFSKNTVTIDMFGSAKYRGYKYGADDHVAVVHTEKLSKNAAKFVTTAIHKAAHAGQFDYSRNFYATDANELIIQLPVSADGKIAFAYIEKFVETLEAERLATLEAYLQATGLKDTELSEAEAGAIEVLDMVEWKKFALKDLFEITTPKKKFNANTINFNGNFPYVARGESNNGIRGYIDEDEKYLNDGNTISFGQDTATMFYQEKPYFTGDKIKIFTAKNSVKFDKYIAQIMISAMKKAFSTFSWGSSSYNVNILQNTKIQLPVSADGTIDYDFMSNLTKAMQKIVIKGVVALADERLNATEGVLK